MTVLDSPLDVIAYAALIEMEGGKKGRFDDGSDKIIGACIEVHRQLGPGLLESVYEQCLSHEFSLVGLRFQRQRAVPVPYKGVLLDCGHRLDFVLEDKIILELKTVDRLLPIHEAQVLTYLKLTGLDAALLVNFNVTYLKQGLRRYARRQPRST